MRRVVVTGLGAVTPLGSGIKSNWDNLMDLKSGISGITQFDVSDVTSKIAGSVPRGHGFGEYNPDNLMSLKEQRKVSDFIMYGMDAADQAIADAELDTTNEEELHRIGVIIGSGIGGIHEIYDNTKILEEKGPRRISPFFIPSSLINLVSGQVSIKHGFKGPNHSVVTACATGTHAIGDAFRIIKYGDADAMVAGGSESALTKLALAGFASARALSTGYNDTPEQASRPWDEGRDGFVMGEGAGVVVLEELESAKKRGAKIYGEVIGYGMSGDAYHITSPAENGDGAFRCMKNTLNDAKINSDQIDYINAHGTSTPMGDRIELSTVARFFEKRSDNLSMSSTKSSTGHLLGAAGAIEAIYTVKAIYESARPATLNLDNSIESHGINLQANQILEKETSYALSNSFGFGGTNASLIFKKFDE
ncbi:MAG: beta-ketoacyl-ACP synthase II [Rickettsiales bacterium]|jgi:3-oxoacyl-[acyl-carrier-protein] synthase II|nr:beta-ketoacyl-ACP synthase II [Rickettsiales bacterium]